MSVVAVPTRKLHSCFCSFRALTYIYNKPWVTATNSGFIVCKRLARKSKYKKALRVATFWVTIKVRFGKPTQKITRCKSCLTTSTGYRGEACIKNQSPGELWPRKRCVLSCPGRVGQARERAFVSGSARNHVTFTRSHYILTTRNPFSTCLYFLAVNYQKPLSIILLFWKVKEKKPEKRERGWRGREGEKVASFLYNEHTMHVFLFFACLSLSPTKNYIKLRKNNEKPHKKRKNSLFFGVFSVFSSSRKVDSTHE